MTGRTHQIRAHLASLGHPIANDWKYGGTTETAQHAAPIPGMEAHFMPDACEECAAVAPAYAQLGHVVANVDARQSSSFEIWLHAVRYSHPDHGTFETPRPAWASEP